MAKNFSVVVTNTSDREPVVAGALHRTVAQICTELKAAAAGASTGTTVLKVAGDAGRASGTVTITGVATNTYSVVINGVTAAAAVLFDTDLATTAAAIAAAINASSNAMVAGHVTATASGAVVTVKAVAPGIVGNTITLASSSVGGTAVSSGARLTGGAVTDTYTL